MSSKEITFRTVGEETFKAPEKGTYMISTQRKGLYQIGSKAYLLKDKDVLLIDETTGELISINGKKAGK